MSKRFESKAERNARIFRYIFSLFFSILLFIAFSFGGREKRTVSIPLTIIPSREFVNNSNINSSVDVQIIGDPKIIYNVNPDKIKAFLDCAKVDREGSCDIDVRLEYNLGVIEGSRIEIVNLNPTQRISFKKR